MPFKILNSIEDQSVNFVEQQLIGFLESRFVRKCDDYFIAYLSSQTGCNRGCTFCHLTATKQTSFTDSSHNDFLDQAMQVFKHYRKQKPARYMHYNFMARGEPLANKVILESGNELLMKLGEMARGEGLPAKFNVSTIMPLTFKGSLVDVFSTVTPTIYYSLYSVDPITRAKLMPGAMHVYDALNILKDYQKFTKKVVKIHYPFISGVNDSFMEVLQMCDLVCDTFGLICDFNLVRYNPANAEQGVETSEVMIEQNLDYIRKRFKGKVQMIPRVGFDVKASCGMFV